MSVLAIFQSKDIYVVIFYHFLFTHARFLSDLLEIEHTHLTILYVQIFLSIGLHTWKTMQIFLIRLIQF